MQLNTWLAKLLVCMWSAGATAAQPWTLSGLVAHVHDGDTVTLLDDQKRQHKIRLDGIDAPELDQAFSKASRRNLQEHALRRTATAQCHKTDRHARQVCRVQVEGNDTGRTQLEAGFAWIFRRYERELPAAGSPRLRHRRAPGAKRATPPVERQQAPRHPSTGAAPTPARGRPRERPIPEIRAAIVGSNQSTHDVAG